MDEQPYFAGTVDEGLQLESALAEEYDVTVPLVLRKDAHPNVDDDVERLHLPGAGLHHLRDLVLRLALFPLRLAHQAFRTTFGR